MIFRSIADFDAALADLSTPAPAAIEAARARQAQLTKPAGSLGRIEDIALFFAGWQLRERPRIDRSHVPSAASRAASDAPARRQ